MMIHLKWQWNLQKLIHLKYSTQFWCLRFKSLESLETFFNEQTTVVFKSITSIHSQWFLCYHHQLVYLLLISFIFPILLSFVQLLTFFFTLLLTFESLKVSLDLLKQAHQGSVMLHHLDHQFLSVWNQKINKAKTSYIFWQFS